MAGIILLVRENPDVGANAGAEENLGGQRDDCLDIIVLQQEPSDLGFALPGVTVEQRRSGQDDGGAPPATFRRFELADEVEQEQHRAVAHARELGTKASFELLFAVLPDYCILILVPLLTEGGI